MKHATFLIAALLLLSAAGCKATKNYPDPLPGWHSPDFSVIYGRLQHVAPANPESPSVWIIRFGLANERYGGEFALTPPDQLNGFVGGEQVEIKGHILSGRLLHPEYPGTMYQVDQIHLWSNYR